MPLFKKTIEEISKVVGILQEAVQEDLLKSLEENQIKFWSELNVDIDVTSEIVQISSNISHYYFNGIFKSQFSSKKAPQIIQKTINYFKEHNLPFSWWTHDRSTPFDLGDQLEVHDLKYNGECLGMSCDLSLVDISLPKPSKLVIELVSDKQMMEEYAAHIGDVFGIPQKYMKEYANLFIRRGFSQHQPFRHFLGKIHGKTVATSTLFMQPHVAGIYNLSVIPEVRHLGIGVNMAHELMLNAQLMDCRIAVLQSFPEAANMYQRLGFEEICKFQHYSWMP